MDVVRAEMRALGVTESTEDTRWKQMICCFEKYINTCMNEDCVSESIARPSCMGGPSYDGRLRGGELRGGARLGGRDLMEYGTCGDKIDHDYRSGKNCGMFLASIALTEMCPQKQTYSLSL